MICCRAGVCRCRMPVPSVRITDLIGSRQPAKPALSNKPLIKCFYLALMNISRKWAMPLRDWKVTLNRFCIQLEERMRANKPMPFTQNSDTLIHQLAHEMV